MPEMCIDGIHTTMNGEKYVKLLTEKLAIHIHFHKCTIFICHFSVSPFRRSEEFSDACKGHNAGVSRKQSDVNPMEKLWEFLKITVADELSSSASVLRYAINNVAIKNIYIYIPCLLFVTLKKVYDRNVENKYRLCLLLCDIIFNLIDYMYIYILFLLQY